MIRRLPSSDWKWIVCFGLRESNYTTRKRFLATKFEESPKIVSPTNLFIRCTDDLKLRHNQISLLIAKDSTDSEQVNAVFKSLLESNRDDVNWVLNYFTDHFYRIKLLYCYFSILSSVTR